MPSIWKVYPFSANLAYLDFPLHRPPPEKLARVANSPHPLPREKNWPEFPHGRNNPGPPTPPQSENPASVQIFCFDESGSFPFERVSVSSSIVRIPVIKLI